MSQKIKNNYLRITNNLKPQTKLLAVTKSVSAETIRILYELGQRDFGENRVSDLKDKAEILKDLKDIRWHFIGNLQSKKVKDLFKIENLKYIHSVDSLSLIDELIKRSSLLKNSVNLFLQVNTSMEEEKSGFINIQETEVGVEKILSLANSPLKLYGLMTMGKLRTEDFSQAARICFSKLKLIQETLLERHPEKLFLSMGMSADYQIAEDVGTDWVRLGGVLFE